jgi:Subtilase family
MMRQARSSCRRAEVRPGWRRGATVLAACASLCALLPPLATAARGGAGDGDLSARLRTLARPAVGSAPPAKQARALGLAEEGAGSLLREGRRVVVEVRFARGAAAALGDLRGAGAQVLDLNRRYRTVTVAALPEGLGALAGLPRVAAVTEVLAPIAASTCPSGEVVSEGLAQLRAQEAQATFGVDGSGVEVGVLSDSFDQDGSAATDESDDVESGDLPGAANTCPGQSTPVDVLEDFNDPEAADEGRAMAQIVHDVAPGAELSFATAFTGLTAFAGNVEDLAAAGADVIVDDVSYFEEPFFQEGPVGVAVSEVSGDGVSYFSSAGNNNLIDEGRDIASWEAPAFRDSSPTVCPTGVPPYAQHCMDFDPGAGVDPTFGIAVEPESTLLVDLQWAQPWDGVTTDLDAYLLNSADLLVAKSEEFNVALSQRPFELLGWENASATTQVVRVAINRCDLVCDAVGGGDEGSPRLKLALLQNGGGVSATEYESSLGGDVVGPAIFGHNGAEDAVSVGAIRFSATAAPEDFSSRGPVTHYFGPVAGGTPAPPLSTPRVLAKPDLVATDCGMTTFFVPTGTPGLFRFCGTSAAAPHAAGVAALMRQEKPGATPAEIRAALADSAVAVGSFGPDAVGAGLLDAVGALGEIAASKEGEGSGTTPPPGEAEEDIRRANPAAIPEPISAVRRPRPQTFFRRHPPRSIRTPKPLARAVFRFGASESDVTFLCRIDREPFRVCRPRLVRRFRPGRHVVRVVARDSLGQTDPTPAIFRFRVERI